MSLTGERKGGGGGPTTTTRRAAGRYSSAFETSLPPTTEEEDHHQHSIVIPKRGAKLQRRVTSSTYPMATATMGDERGPLPPVNKTRSCSTASSTTTSSRFSFLNRFTGSSPTTTTLPPVDDEKDDLIQLDVEQTLHSLSSPTDGAAFSPAAFKNLQIIATSLLTKFQTAYTERTKEVRELRAEKEVEEEAMRVRREVEEEEKEEMEVKVEHLKMQLQVMVKEAEEKEEAMKSLVGELGRERKLRAELQAERKRRSCGSGSLEEQEEDLEVEEDQGKRGSGEYESDQETTEAASVFSRSRSPTITTMGSIDTSPTSPVASSATSPNTTPKAPAVLQAAPAITRTPRQRSPSLFSQTSSFSQAATSILPQTSSMTTFQKLFKGKVATTCQCNGQDSSVAWDTVSLLRDENRGLKERVGDLEQAVEGALDVVNLVGM